MQIFKTTIIKSVQADTGGSTEAPNTTPTELDPEIQQRVEGFFGEDVNGDGQTAVQAPDNPFDLLFAGAPSVPGTVGGGPSVNDFSPSKVVTVEDWIGANPTKAPYILDKYVKKMETVRDTRFVEQKKNLEESLQQEGLSPQERIAIQEKIREIDAAIVKINQEIDKANERIAKQKENYSKELYGMEDYNGDGYIGDPMDKDNSFIKAKHPRTGQDILLDPKTMKPAINPWVDREYQPALLSTEGVEKVENPDGIAPEDRDNTVYLKLNGSNHVTGSGYADNSFGAQLDITAVEGFWVEAEKDGTPKKNEGYPRTYKYKELGVVTINGKEMLGQVPPTQEEMKDKKYIFVRATDLNIYSQEIDKKDKKGNPLGGGYVFFEFTNAKGEIILKIRVEGTTVSNATSVASGQMADGKYYIAATTVGVAVNGGRKRNADGTSSLIEHLGRVSPIQVNAQNYQSTGRVLAVVPGKEDVDSFYQEAGIDKKTNKSGSILQKEFGSINTDEGKKRAERAQSAADYTLRGGFLDADPAATLNMANYNADVEGMNQKTAQGESLLSPNEDLANAINTAAEVRKKFGLKNGRVAVSAVFLANDDEKYDGLRTGVFFKDLRGALFGTNDNDIFIVPSPDDDAIDQLLKYNQTEETITSDNPIYGTVIDGGAGRNFVRSYGGDLYAKGVSALVRDSNRNGDRLYIQTSQGGGSESAGAGLASDNQSIFIEINDKNPAAIDIDNGTDKNDYHPNGIADDFYDIQAIGSTAWTATTDTADRPAGVKTNSEKTSAEAINGIIDGQLPKIVDEVIHKDWTETPEGSEIGWEYNEDLKQMSDELDQEDATRSAFFDEFSFFNEDQANE